MDLLKRIRRRAGLVLAGALLGLAAGCAGSDGAPSGAAPETAAVEKAPAFAPVPHPALPPLFDDLERRTFDFFWQTADPASGLVPDRWPSSPDFASIASVGFALVAYADGAQRGYVSRAQARDRVLATVRFFDRAPQGPQAEGTAGYKGFFYHWLDRRTGLRFNHGVELSTIDTSLLVAGMLFSQAYFDRDDPAEAEIRTTVDRIYGRIDWRWAQVRPPLISMGWTPEHGFIEHDYRGYDEAMILYLLALGSATLPVEPAAWTGFTSTYARSWGSFMGRPQVGGAPLFWHQYTHLFVDFRGIRDAYMRGKGLDYFENARRATLAQRDYAIADPGAWRDYGADVWGLTACDGPGHVLARDARGRLSQFMGYAARGAGLIDTRDDGTIAPTAAAGSLPFAPEAVIPAVEALHRRFGDVIYSTYGFADAFNRSFTAEGQAQAGRVVPGWGWVGTDYVGIDQGPIIGMIGNYRDELVWRPMRRHPALRRALQRAGFEGGWLND